MRHASEIRSMDQIDELTDMPSDVKPAEVEARPAGHGDLRRRSRFPELQDEYSGKACARSSTPRSKGARSSRRRSRRHPKVVNLMEALRKSLDSISSGKKKTAPAATAGRQNPNARQAESAGVNRTLLLSSHPPDNPGKHQRDDDRCRAEEQQYARESTAIPSAPRDPSARP